MIRWLFVTAFLSSSAVLARALTKPPSREPAVVHRPPEISAFEFVILSSHRAAQLMRGCTPRVPAGEKTIVTAQREVAGGMITRSPESQAAAKTGLPG
jgi:DNA-directed RNA polymerase subunit K/omega